jgi:hypothetical protein
MGWKAIQMTMAKTVHTPMNPVEACKVMLPFYITISAAEGTPTCKEWLDTELFFKLNEMNAFCFCLAKHLYMNTKDETVRSELRQVEKVGNKTADALVAMGNRFNKKGKYAATPSNIKMLCTCVSWLEEMMRVAGTGVVLTAMIDAANLVDSKVSQLGK